MKRYLLVLVVALLGCVAIPALAGESVALLKSATGNVKVIRQHQAFEATSGTRLRVSDRVVTGKRASAAIVFQDGTQLTLGADANVVVRDYLFESKQGKFAFSVYLAKGSAIYESGKIGKLSPRSVKVATPRAMVGVRGTRFLIQAD